MSLESLLIELGVLHESLAGSLDMNHYKRTRDKILKLRKQIIKTVERKK